MAKKAKRPNARAAAVMTADRLEELRRLASKWSRADVECHPYDIGYWLWVGGEGLPKDACEQMREGYEAASVDDDEITRHEEVA